jgi:hypothetical protein
MANSKILELGVFPAHLKTHGPAFICSVYHGRTFGLLCNCLIFALFVARFQSCPESLEARKALLC